MSSQDIYAKKPWEDERYYQKRHQEATKEVGAQPPCALSCWALRLPPFLHELDVSQPSDVLCSLTAYLTHSATKIGRKPFKTNLKHKMMCMKLSIYSQLCTVSIIFHVYDILLGFSSYDNQLCFSQEIFTYKVHNG